MDGTLDHAGISSSFPRVLAASSGQLVSGGAQTDALLSAYRSMLRARLVDQAKADLVNRRQAFFHAPGSGHEAAAVLNEHLIAADWLHLHYRDKALLLARGLSAEAFLHSVLCNSESHSAGRQMSAMMSSRELNILSTATLIGNNALQAVGVAASIKAQPERPIVVCSMGDGGTQQGEVLEAIAEAARSELPVLFLIEDNGLAISTSTAGKTFFSLPAGSPDADSIFGLPIHRLDGRDAASALAPLGLIVQTMRATRKAAIVIFQVERLTSHTNADDERVYRSGEALQQARTSGDPVLNLRRHLLERGVSPRALDEIKEHAEAEVLEATERALRASQPTPTTTAKAPLPKEQLARSAERRGTASGDRLTMIEAIRNVLRAHLACDARVTLYGQDIEDPKGDVFGVTRGLSTQFPDRVTNSPLSESTIVGTSIGRALVGERPVGFIQFADFLPVAYNQIMSEMGSMYWRTNGDWQCPVILMVACGAYRPGLGPFHAQTFEALAAYVPGVDVVMPSNATDAAGLLNAAFASGRPTVFFYPKLCLNDRDETTPPDVEEQFVPLGRARHVTRGTELTIVAWGNTVHLCQKAAETLTAAGASVELIDLRSISPWDREAVCTSVTKTRKLLVVHEDGLTGGFGGEVAATVAEAVPGPLAVRRITRPDTYVPFNFTNQLEILPSFHRILSLAARMLDFDLEWRQDAQANSDILTIAALGSSPADQAVSVVAWKVKIGDRIKANDSLAEMEADKAVFELTSPVDGIVEEILVPEGISVRIQSPILHVRTTQVAGGSRQLSREEAGQPILRRRIAATPAVAAPRIAPAATVGMSVPCATVGSGFLTNDDLVHRFPGRTSQDIVQRTGILRRARVLAGESPLTMAVNAARRALAADRLLVSDLSCIICSTTTPLSTTPSLACRVHAELCREGKRAEMPCFDILAACTGYLYALSTAFDFLQSRPTARVLVVTAEVLSQVTNPDDFDTSPLFGDAASATILYGSALNQPCAAQLHRPLISASGEDGALIHVPAPGNGYVKMDGKKVFADAVRQMIAMLTRACGERQLTVKDLDLIVPHQANARIIEAIRSRLAIPAERIVNRIEDTGNTSSSSIPLCLEHVLAAQPSGSRLGLCAYGGGLTFGAAIMTKS